MPGGDSLGVLDGEPIMASIRAGPADQALARRFAERQPELDAWHGADQRLVKILDRLDEMALAQDEIDVVRLLDSDKVQLQAHRALSFPHIP